MSALDGLQPEPMVPIDENGPMIQPSNNASPSLPGRVSSRFSMPGWGISLLVHALAIAWFWHAAPPAPVDPDTGPARQITVWLVQEKPPAPHPATAPLAAPSPPRPTRAAPRPEPALRQPRSSAGPDSPVVSQLPVVVASPSAQASHNDHANVADGNAPAFDLTAARASARAMAREDRKGMGGLPQRQEGTGLTSSDRLQERFERARRPDCLKGTDSANLLANVFFLAKDIAASAVKDGGCKW